jgi:hypothetical protein
VKAASSRLMERAGRTITKHSTSPFSYDPRLAGRPAAFRRATTPKCPAAAKWSAKRLGADGAQNVIYLNPAAKTPLAHFVIAAWPSRP